MQGFSNYMSSKVVDQIFGNQSLSIPATIYAAMAKGNVQESDTGSTFDEADYTDYTRIALTNDLSNFPLATNGQKSVATDITFPLSSGGSNTIKELVFLDAASDGNIIAAGVLTIEKTVNSGDQPVFLAGTVELTLF